MIDLRDERVRHALGVDLGTLVGTRGPCQALARRANRLGATGMVVPSAARDGAWNVVVFPTGFGSLEPLGSAVRSPAAPER